MKIRAERSEFAEAITWATRTVGARVTLPALSGILLEAAEGRLVCRATDLEVAAEVSVPVQVESAGRALLPGRLLGQLVAKLPEAPVRLHGGADRVEIRCGQSRFNVRGMPVEDFPSLPEPAEDAVRGVIKAEGFVRLVNQVSRAASSDEARPVLTGVRLEASGGVLTAAATDSYRLAVRRVRWDEIELSALVPARALQEAARAAAEAGGAVTVVSEQAQVSFLFGDRRLTTRLIEGTFPDYAKLLPDGFESRAVVDRVELTEALQRVSVVAVGQANTPVALTFGEGVVELDAGNQELGDASEAVPVDLEGEGLVIAFNPTFLLAGLDAVGSERVGIELRDGLKPAVLRPEGSPDAGEGVEADDFLYLLMPMRVS